MSQASTPLKKIAVLVSIGLHPVSRQPRYSRNDATALAVAYRLSAEQGAAVDVIHAGEADDPALADYLALGAARVEVLASGPDAEIVPILAARVAGYDLVLTGVRAEGGMDTGLVPYALADTLGCPVVADALELQAMGGELHIRQFLPKGVRRHVAVHAPVVVAVHPLAPVTVRYAYARQRAGRIVAVPSGNANPPAVAPMGAALRVAPARASADATNRRGADATAWQTQPASVRPKKLAATEKRTGHARMLAATVAESRGGRVVIDGTSVEKAKVVLSYLREHQLIDY